MPSQGRVRRCFPRRVSPAREGGPRVGTFHLGYQRFRTWLSSKYASMFTYTGISIFLDYPEYRSLQTTAWAAKVERALLHFTTVWCRTEYY